MNRSEKTILVIEDNPINMRLASAVLGAGGYVVLPAQTAEEGIALARAEQPALILMDLSLPGMDGLSAARVLRHDPLTRRIPVVALTAHAMTGDEEIALAAGCAAYASKPFDRPALLALLARLIEGDT